MIEFEAAEPAKIGDNALKYLVGLADQQVELEAKIVSAEKRVVDLKEELRILQCQTLPETMKEVGLSTFTLANGATVEVSEDLKMSLSGPKKINAAKWLRKIGEEAMVKQTVIIDAGAGKAAAATVKKILKFAIGSKLAAKAVEDVNTGSLKALVRRRKAAGQSVIDLKEIGGFEETKSVISMKE